VRGGTGNDLIDGKGGNDTLDGGLGTDTARFTGKSTGYTWSQNTDGSWTVKDNARKSPDGTDKLISVEVLQFSDRSVTIGTASAAVVGDHSEESGVHNLPAPLGDSFAFRLDQLKSIGVLTSAQALWLDHLDDRGGDLSAILSAIEDRIDAFDFQIDHAPSHSHHGADFF